jgi:hypothetical protein
MIDYHAGHGAGIARSRYEKVCSGAIHRALLSLRTGEKGSINRAPTKQSAKVVGGFFHSFTIALVRTKKLRAFLRVVL